MNKTIPDKIYHGSPVKFSKFDLNKIGTNKGTSGASIGLYFTTSIQEALTYGNFIYVVDFNTLKLKQNLSNFTRTLNGIKIIKLIDYCLEISKGEDNYYDNYDDYHYDDYINNKKLNLKKEINREIINSFLKSTDTEIIGSLANAGISSITIFEALNKLNYNYTLDQYDSPQFKNSQHYVLYFEPKISEKLTFKDSKSLQKYLETQIQS